MTVTDNPGGYHGSCATGGPRGTLHISTIIPCYHMIITGCFLGVSSYSVKLELAKYYKDSEMTALISERSRNS